MPLVINTNVSALNSQRQLVKSGMDLSQAMERLSSGKRINTAADDAAGLAIANRQTAQIRGLGQAVRNANDGVSMIQTAEGALDEVTNILQRMRELAIQSANGIYGDTDRASLDAEVQQLKAEMDRISETTSFNGQPLLDGSVGVVDLQVGSQAYETISFTIASVDTSDLGAGIGGDIIGTQMVLGAMSTISTGEIRINGQDLGSFTSAAFNALDGNVSTGSLNAFLDKMNTNISGIEAAAFVEMSGSTDGTGIIRGSDVLTLDVDMADGTTQQFQITDTGNLEELADKISSVSGGVVTGTVNDSGRLIVSSDNAAQIAVNGANANVRAALGTASNSSQQAQLVLTSSSGNDITIAYTAAGSDERLNIGLDQRTGTGDLVGTNDASGGTMSEGDVLINGITIGSATAATAQAKVNVINKSSADTGVVASVVTGVTGGTTSIKLDSVSGDEISIEYAANGSAATLGILQTNIAETAGLTIDNVDISTVRGAQSSLGVIDGALETINSTRADMGAINNRLDFTMSNLMNVIENTEAARSRIMDADFAAETSNLSRAQVLQQASQAMLAQANARPQQVLQLLNG